MKNLTISVMFLDDGVCGRCGHDGTLIQLNSPFKSIHLGKYCLTCILDNVGDLIEDWFLGTYFDEENQ